MAFPPLDGREKSNSTPSTTFLDTSALTMNLSAARQRMGSGDLRGPGWCRVVRLEPARSSVPTFRCCASWWVSSPPLRLNAEQCEELESSFACVCGDDYDVLRAGGSHST